MNKEYAQMVADLKCKDYEGITKRMASTIDLDHACKGLATEAAEVVDSIKRHHYYGTPLDTVNIIEELGDIEFYAELARAALGVTREEVLAINTAKLKKRYPDGAFDADDAVNRDIEGEREVLEGGGWAKNTGTMPVDDDVSVEVKIEGMGTLIGEAGSFGWELEQKGQAAITEWRLSK